MLGLLVCYFSEAARKIGDLMDEGVLVADLQTGHPPARHIRMIGIGDVDASPAAQAAFIAVIEKLQAVQIVQVPALQKHTRR